MSETDNNSDGVERVEDVPEGAEPQEGLKVEECEVKEPEVPAPVEAAEAEPIDAEAAPDAGDKDSTGEAVQADLEEADPDEEGDDEDEPDAEEEAAAEPAEEDFDQAADDPLGEAYDLEKGEPIPSEVHADSAKLPWKSKIESAKEFFNTEILYRHDILLAEERDRIAGRYRIELKGYQGGIWSVDVGEDIEVVNRREDADVVLAMQQKDFLRVVNGELNPQLALLSRKIKITGDVRKAVALQSLLAPAVD